MDGGGRGYEEVQMEGDGYNQQWDEEEDEWDENPQDEGGGQLVMYTDTSDTTAHDADAA